MAIHQHHNHLRLFPVFLYWHWLLFPSLSLSSFLSFIIWFSFPPFHFFSLLLVTFTPSHPPSVVSHPDEETDFRFPFFHFLTFWKGFSHLGRPFPNRFFPAQVHAAALLVSGLEMRFVPLCWSHPVSRIWYQYESCVPCENTSGVWCSLVGRRCRNPFYKTTECPVWQGNFHAFTWQN